MHLFYDGLRAIFGRATRAYYREVRVLGAEHIPRSGAMIVVANHPNSAVDAALLAGLTDRRLSFLVNADFLDVPGLGAVLRACDVVPVQRKPESPTDNAVSFARARAVLQRGGALAMFPEGRHSREREVRRLKTGLARIALDAERTQPVRLVPVGLGYEDRDGAGSRVVVRVGEPIMVGRGSSDDPESVKRLTKTVKRALERLVVEANTNGVEEDDWNVETAVEPGERHTIGGALNAIPRGACGWLGRRAPNEPRRAFQSIVAGLFVYPGWYAAVFALVGYATMLALDGYAATFASSQYGSTSALAATILLVGIVVVPGWRKNERKTGTGDIETRFQNE